MADGGTCLLILEDCARMVDAAVRYGNGGVGHWIRDFTVIFLVFLSILAFFLNNCVQSCSFSKILAASVHYVLVKATIQLINSIGFCYTNPPCNHDSHFLVFRRAIHFDGCHMGRLHGTRYWMKTAKTW